MVPLVCASVSLVCLCTVVSSLHLTDNVNHDKRLNPIDLGGQR